MTPVQNKQFVQNMFRDVIENPRANSSIYKKYFSTDFVQYVDGKKNDYPHFLLHLQALKTAIKTVSIAVEHIVAEGDKVATVHTARGVKRDGSTFATQVNAVFQVKDSKIVLCNELTHLLTGSESDRDLGSRH